MSQARDRAKHATRRHRNWRAIRHQLDIAHAHGMEVKTPHRLAKHHALNCGNSRCMLCSNPRRTWKEKTVQEKRAEQDTGDE